MCALAEAPEPQIRWWREERGWTPDPNLRTFGFATAGWCRSSEDSVINIVLVTYDDEQRSAHTIPSFVRHELCHLFQSWSPSLWQLDKVVGPWGNHRSLSRAKSAGGLAGRGW